MATSQNGWPIVNPSAIVDKAVLGVEFPNGWLKGDVDVIFTDLILHLNDIEQIVNGTCWGWFVKTIEGSTTKSNHGSGTAIDYNAQKHPMGVRNTYSQNKRDAIHKLLKRYEGVIQWGGDYERRPDDMHFEIDDDSTAVKRVATKIRNENEVDMDSKELIHELLNTDLGKKGGNDTVGMALQAAVSILPRVERIESHLNELVNILAQPPESTKSS